MVDEVATVTEKVWVKCSKCGYVWESRGNLGYVTCPNCMRKVNMDKGKRLAEREQEQEKR